LSAAPCPRPVAAILRNQKRRPMGRRSKEEPAARKVLSGEAIDGAPTGRGGGASYPAPAPSCERGATPPASVDVIRLILVDLIDRRAQDLVPRHGLIWLAAPNRVFSSVALVKPNGFDHAYGHGKLLFQGWVAWFQVRVGDKRGIQTIREKVQAKYYIGERRYRANAGRPAPQKDVRF
jgi:hypothetical protein